MGGGGVPQTVFRVRSALSGLNSLLVLVILLLSSFPEFQFHLNRRKLVSGDMTSSENVVICLIMYLFFFNNTVNHTE